MEWLDRFVMIMNFISEQVKEGMGVTELSNVTGLSKGTLHRMLRSMVDHNLITQKLDTKKYCLGPKAMLWGSRFVLGQDPSGLLAGYCDLLAKKTNLYTFLCRMDADEVYCIYTSQPSKMQKKYFVHVGQRMPIHCTAAAKSILAFLPFRQIEYLLSQNYLTQFTEATKMDIGQIIEELQCIKQTKIAFCNEELENGVSAISTPVFLANDEVGFSLSLICDACFLKNNERLLVDELLKMGKKTSEHMGMANVLSSAKGDKYERIK